MKRQQNLFLFVSICGVLFLLCFAVELRRNHLITKLESIDLEVGSSCTSYADNYVPFITACGYYNMSYQRQKFGRVQWKDENGELINLYSDNLPIGCETYQQLVCSTENQWTPYGGEGPIKSYWPNCSSSYTPAPPFQEVASTDYVTGSDGKKYTITMINCVINQSQVNPIPCGTKQGVQSGC